MSSDPALEVQPAKRGKCTLGDLLYSNSSKTRVAENEWIDLVRAIAVQDIRALRSLYERSHRLVFTLALRITGTRQIAEEVTLDVFHDTWRKASRFDGSGGTVLGWIMNQARSRALDRLRYERRLKRVNPYADSPLAMDPEPTPHECLEKRDRSRQLRSAIGTLTAEERSAIEVAYFSEMSHVEVAVRLNQPLGTIKTRIRSGLQKLRRMMDSSRRES